jgi:DNA-binding CsgD family transcriptional regulator
MTYDRPGPLTPTEQAIIESIRRGAPDAEIAARLGISIVDVKRKVEVLKDRYQVEHRASLGQVDTTAEWRGPMATTVPSSETNPAERQPGDTFRDHFTARDDVEAPVHSRRAVLGALLAGGAAVTGVGAYFLLEGDNDAPPARPDPFATNTPTPTSTPLPTATPHPGLNAIQPAPDAWIRRTYANGQPIDLPHGVAFINTTTGQTEVLSLSDDYGDVQGGSEYAVSPLNDVLAVSRGWSDLLGRPGAAFRRSTRESLTWDADALDLVTFNDKVLVFHRFDRLLNLRTGILDVVDTSLRKVSQVELPSPSIASGTWARPIVVISGDGRHLAHVAHGELYIAEVASGAAASVPLREVLGVHLGRYHMKSAQPPAAFTIDGFFTTSLMEGQRHEVDFDEHGEVLDVREVHEWSYFRSPDGRHAIHANRLRHNFLPQGAAAGLQPYHPSEEWTYCQLINPETGDSSFRILSGGLQGTQPWLADSAGFVVEGRAIDAPLDNFEAWVWSRQSYLVTPDGDIEAIPPLPVDGRPLHPRLHGIQPSPDGPDLFSLGGRLVWDRAANRTLGPGEPPAPASFEPWGETSTEMRLTFPGTTERLVGSATMLPPRMEYPPYREEVTLEVARSGTCVYLREHPVLDGEVLDCLPDGTRLTVVDPPEPPYPERLWQEEQTTAFYGEPHGENGQMFVHVRTQDGRTGWVAIQYLDWA